MQRLRERFGINQFFGIVVLLMLFSFAGDDALRALFVSIPGVDEAIPCSWLQSPTDPGNHQSMIGRMVIKSGQSPLRLSVRSSKIPQTDQEQLVIWVTVINNTIGTVPFVYHPDEVAIGSTNTSGLGIIFDPPTSIPIPGINQRNDPPTYPNERIRLLNPEQRCIHKITLRRDQLNNTILSGNATVQAYYRGVRAGQVPPVTAPVPTPIYRDQGLYVGELLSAAVPIPNWTSPAKIE
jgi:hypothetical protein